MSIAKYEPHELLSLMRLPQHEGIYVLGCFERRVTLYSQQVRGTNLAFSLNAAGELKETNGVVAVIGGGAAGLTLAAALLEWTGAAVVLLERHDRLMPIQRTCENRWLHPHLYDWPAEGSLIPDANLPFLTWRESRAAEVVQQIEAQWNAIAARHASRAAVHYGATDVRLEKRVPRGGVLSWNGEKGYNSVAFDTVVLAVGYGIEAAAPPAQNSYWAGDDLELAPSGHRRKWLVSGSGDGALADVLRLTLHGAAKNSTLTYLVSDVTHEEACRRLLEVERTVRNPAKVHDAYTQLCVPVAQKMQGELRLKHEVTWNGRSQHPFGSRASILNRFLVAQLTHLKAVRYRPGEWTSSTIAPDGSVQAQFDGSVAETFDRVVKRYGPQAALETDFKWIWDAFATQRQMWQETSSILDRSRVPMWPEPAPALPRIEGKERKASDTRPVGAPPGTVTQAVDRPFANDINAEVFGSVIVPPKGEPIRINLEIRAVNTTRRALPLAEPYRLAIKNVEQDGLTAHDAYGELEAIHRNGAVNVYFHNRPEIPAGGSYRWELSIVTPGAFRTQRTDEDLISGVYAIRPEHRFQDADVRFHTFWYDFIFLKPKGEWSLLREYRIIQSNNRGLRCRVTNEWTQTRCSFNQFQLGPHETLKIQFTCLYMPREFVPKWWKV